jgi:hypothetical protein
LRNMWMTPDNILGVDIFIFIYRIFQPRLSFWIFY